ncbi:MAG: two-component system, LytTR family, sensor kinase [Gammaproteobacteria bacterium]|nr:two-component system, LytTR family, sensor kinase [Gammaproteobacteria bacterium]
MIDVRAYARSTGWTWIAAIWCAGALFNASQTLLTMHAVGVGKGWLRPILIVFVSWLPWALATPFVIELARRWPIVRGEIFKAMSPHLAAFAAISVTAEGWSALLRVIFDPWHRSSPPTFVNTWSDLLVEQLMTFVIAYALILTVTYVVDSREKMTRQMTETARLNEELSRAQLAVLRSQMDPHFMFNTLNSIASLVYDQRGDAAVGMIVGLSEFLRRASEDSHRSQVTLREEVEYLQRYIDIQKVRFGDRLRVSVDIPDELLATQVPNLLLQPLVENAIKHGVSKRRSGGEIRVAGMCRDGTLRLTVYNDGPWAQEDLAVAPHRVGLGNLRTRLQILHGDRSELLLQPAEAGGVEVIVTLPLQEA